METKEFLETLRAGNCRKILVGMSGGVDSAYTALLLKENGFSVEGVLLRMSDSTETLSAQTAAEQVGIPLHILDAREIFDTQVKQYFAESYARGETPNPCVVCNRRVKVELLCAYAEEHGFDRVSTGHYAKILRDPESGRYYAARADDRKKDQSYMLWQLTQKQLSMLITPLAALDKQDIRRDAAARGLRAAEAKESQDICFLPDGGYVSFVENRLGTFPEGDFVDENGTVVGRHKGIIRYTVGQRKGLGIALGHPVFVTDIDPAENRVYLAPAGMEYMHGVTVCGIHLQKLQPGTLRTGMRVLVKIRYAAQPAPAVIRSCTEDTLTAEFDTPQRAVTPGQSAVFYDPEDEVSVLFGGWIRKTPGNSV